MAESNKKPRAERTKNIPRQAADWLGMTPCEACPATVLFRPHALEPVMRRRVKNMVVETRTPIMFKAISLMPKMRPNMGCSSSIATEMPAPVRRVRFHVAF